MKRFMAVGLMVIGLMLAAGSAWANNLHVTNVTVVARDDSSACVQFDIAWENSWRYTSVNHDAAWVFFKCQKEGGTTWSHLKLAGSGSNPTGYSTGTGTGVEIVVPDDGVGFFVRRSAEGFGTTSVQNVKAVFSFATNSLVRNDKVSIQTLAVEMVFVATGNFYLGDGSTDETSGFTDGSWTSGATIPFQVTSTNAITVAQSAGNLWYASSGNGGDQGGPIPSAFPNGYNGFYCMKYKITQGQYTDFLNLLTATQAGNRFMGVGGTLQTITTNALGQYICTAPDRGADYVCWQDGIAFADWAGLRPMTELEYEKACRGPSTPVADEYAWGSTNIVRQGGFSGTSGSGTETATPANANCMGNQGGTRAGIFATATSSREQAGAGYWGSMELTGCFYERCVSVGTSGGRGFTGLAGDGALTAAGAADVSGWPVGSSGSLRGGQWAGLDSLKVSDRVYGVLSDDTTRSDTRGFRCVRTAPAGVGP